MKEDEMQELLIHTISFPQLHVYGFKALTFGIDVVDRLFGELREGQLVVFHGSQTCHFLSELLCVRGQLPHVEGGLDSSAVFIDGGNVFDPYFISESARLLGLEPEEALRNIWVSRAFTSYQLTALVTEKLPEILDREESKLVVISDIPALYCDLDIGMLEAKRTFSRITLFLWNLVKEKDLLLVATSRSSGGERKRRLEHYLLGRADIAARVEDGNPHLKLTLEKHPSKPSVSVDLFFEKPRAQFLLEDFVEA